MQLLPPISILVLDDERIDRHRLARLCSGLDRECRLTNAKNLSDFQALVESTTFDLIFVDYRLPDGNGFDAIELAQLSSKNAAAKIIMVTGLAQDDLEDQALHSGCVAFLSKDHLTTAHFEAALARSELIAPLNAPLARANYSREQAEDLLGFRNPDCT